MIACDDKDHRCYLDFDRVSAAGVPRKTSVAILDTDYDNWAVIYACHRKLRLLKNEWVWILSRKPYLEEEYLQEAYSAIADSIRKFDFDRLVTV